MPALLRHAQAVELCLMRFPAKVKQSGRALSPRRFERRHGVRVERNTAAVRRLRRAVIEPRHFMG